MPLTPAFDNPLRGVAVDQVVDEYQRRNLSELSDERLVQAVAGIIGVPRKELPAERYSFALHAPLELMARGALLPYVEPSSREPARVRIASLAANYEASGPPLPAAAERSFDSLSDAAAALVEAVDGEDLERVDGAAAWLGPRVRPDQLLDVLSDHVIDRLSAAGHGNIYLALLVRNRPRGLHQQMLRHPVRELDQAIGPAHRRSAHTQLARPEPPGFPARRAPPDAPRRGCRSRWHRGDGRARRGERCPCRAPRRRRGLHRSRGATHRAPALRRPGHAARSAGVRPLRLDALPHPLPGGAHGRRCLLGPRARAVYVASAYLAAHWATLGRGHLALDWVPEPVDASVEASLQSGPDQAAAAAWHSTSPADTVTTLATSASASHDAHRVKYTLACLDAAAADRTHLPLYLAAAAYLNAWWVKHPDSSDPLPVGRAL